MFVLVQATDSYSSVPILTKSYYLAGSAQAVIEFIAYFLRFVTGL